MEDLVTSYICRLCANVKEHVFQIFDQEGYKLAIGIKINKYLQIQVDEEDSLPKNVCWECFSKLEECSNFVSNSQNAQITLTEKLYPVFTEDDSLKGEHIFPSPSLFDQASTLLDFSPTQIQVDKNNRSTEPFECDNLDLGDTSNSCFYDRPADCLFEERSKNDEPISNIPSGTDLNSSKCDENASNLRKKLNKRKSVVPVRYLTTNLSQVRTKRKLCRKKKMGLSKKKKSESADEDDYSESEAEVFREKYFAESLWMCTSCVEKFDTLGELQNHHITCHSQPPRYMCPLCYKVYMQYHGFVTHLRKFQCNDVHCESCSKIFPNKKLLDLHRRVHVENPPYQCTHCDRSFKQQSGLYAHSRCHLPEHLKKEFACDQCDKCFSTKPNLLTHKKIHTGLRNYICDLCGKSFVQKGNLSAHMLTHSDTKPFSCSVCQKEFKTLLQLRKHNNIHSGEKPHQCDICGRSFRERSTLKEHSRIHTGAMPFSCEFCGKSFRFKGVLTTHRRQHTGERPYVCVECKHQFTNWPNYNKHMKRRHGINKSKANSIKPDGGPQNNSVCNANINQTEPTSIELPSFEDTLQAVSMNTDKTLTLFDETTTEPFVVSEQTFDDSVINQQQNSLLNAYYSITGLQALSPNPPLDVMNSTIHRWVTSESPILMM